MKTNYLKVIAILFFMAITISSKAQQTSKITFEPNDKSLQQYKYPDWFRDAKFGIWAHWGPQAVPRQGDWYARKMYEGPGYIDLRTRKPIEKAQADYSYHLKNYGHPSGFGYKDIIPLWKAERWNPDELMKLYKKVGAKYFVSMGTHHDNFFLWNSKIHRWNSVEMGPHKDVVGLWQEAAKKEGLRFGVSEHLAASYTWFQPAHSSDKTGEKVGIPYDGNDPQYQDLYHGKADSIDTGWMTKNPVWQKEWLTSITELIDMYKPDLLYSDCGLPFGNDVGRSMIAHYYNQDMAKNKGKLEAVYNCKEASNGRFVRDVERGVLDSISEFPWQTDTSIGDWFYRTGQKYRTSNEVVQMLVDIVSKNGNLLINVVQTPEGDLEPDVLQILEGIGNWTKENGEGIYGSRPWKIYGEGPSTNGKQAKGSYGGLKDVRPYASNDIRFTTKDGALFAFCMNIPTDNIEIKSLGKLSKYSSKAVASISMLGSTEKLIWKQTESSLTINKPIKLPEYKVVAFKINFKK
ncbi:MAG TPA: alpha-L-fucosidase [Paludibacter sp.]